MTYPVHDLHLDTDRLLVFGGVYSNYQALLALKSKSKELGFSPEQIICNGDIVAYCAQPEECLQEIKNWGIHTILGNVEDQIRYGQEDCACDFTSGGRCESFSKDWYPYAVSKVTEDSKKWLKSVPYQLKIRVGDVKIGVIHGSVDYISDYIFESTPWELKASALSSMDVDLMVAGHSGLPFLQMRQDRYWLNPGVLGMPANDGTSRVWFATIEIVNGAYDTQFHSLSYDYQKAQKLMKTHGLPDAYANTLVNGIWDNCEILPIQETEKQGIAITFN